jgi:hypothetical protein
MPLVTKLNLREKYLSKLLLYMCVWCCHGNMHFSICACAVCYFVGRGKVGGSWPYFVGSVHMSTLGLP